MSTSNQRKLSVQLLASAAIPLSLIMAPSPASADTVNTDQIVVTATRRAESIQNTGVSVTALTGDALRDRSIDSIEKLSILTPGVHIAVYQGDTTIYIRGIGTPVILAGSDSSTATYLDGVYISRASAIAPNFFDIERVEVLRGPQGTLYGRNATGGAINIITKSPTDELRVGGSLIAGNYGRFKAAGAVSGPLAEGIRMRLSGQAETRNGYTTVHNGAETSKAEDKEDFSIRLKVEADLSENAVFTLTGDYYEADDKAFAYHYASAGYADEIPDWYSSREGAQTFPYFLFKSAGTATAPASRDVYADTPIYHDSTMYGVTGKLDWNIGDHNLTVIGNYRSSEIEVQNDLDLSDANVSEYRRREDHWQWSADFQLSSPADQRLNWIFGGYFLKEENDILNHVYGDFWEPILTQGLLDLQAANVIPTFPVVIPQTEYCCNLELDGDQSTQAWALYLDTSFDLTDRLSLKVGGRYSSEERDGHQHFDLQILSPTPGGMPTLFAPEVAFFPNAISDNGEDAMPDPFGFVISPVIGPETFSAFTPKFGLDYQVRDNVLLYVSAQRGFKSGGYNIGSSQLTPFNPEKIWAYEAGVKSSILDDRLLLNATYFHYDYKDLQSQDSIQNQSIIRNIGKARVDGAEVEFVARPSEGFRLDGSVTYLNAKFTEGELTEPLRPAPLTQPAGTVLRDLDGLALPRAPEWKFNIGAQYAIPLNISPMSNLTLRADYGWQSKVYFTVFNIDAASQDKYGVLKARATLNSDDNRYSLAFFADNLTNEKYFQNQVLTGSLYGSEFIGPLGAPRIFGVELTFNY